MGSPSRFDRFIARRWLEAVGSPPVIFVLWDGTEIRVGDRTPVARLRLKEAQVLRGLVRAPWITLGDSYVDGRLEIEGNLLLALEATFRASSDAKPWARTAARLFGRARVRNTKHRARDNIHHHYDLGNEFYKLWLDPLLLYTCAYFPTPETPLEAAQIAKMEHVCRKLDLRSGETVVEAGCGWGSFALHMAERHGVKVRAFNVSREQIRYAQEQARRRGLADRVEFVLDDYRSIRGRYDVFVSIGMLEHVGLAHYPRLSRVIDRSLAPHGRGLIHSIGRARPQRMNGWLEKRIFPGAYIPSLGEMMPVFEASNLAVLDVENLRLHYARTLDHWLDRFEKAAGRVADMYDERFVRTWRLYLVASNCAFRTGSTQLFQVLFSRAGNDAIPWTRAHVYPGAESTEV